VCVCVCVFGCVCVCVWARAGMGGSKLYNWYYRGEIYMFNGLEGEGKSGGGEEGGISLSLCC